MANRSESVFRTVQDWDSGFGGPGTARRAARTRGQLAAMVIGFLSGPLWRS